MTATFRLPDDYRPNKYKGFLSYGIYGIRLNIVPKEEYSIWNVEKYLKDKKEKKLTIINYKIINTKMKNEYKNLYISKSDFWNAKKINNAHLYR